MTLLLDQAQIADPISHYRSFQRQRSVYFDPLSQSFALFRYADCRAVLAAEQAQVATLANDERRRQLPERLVMLIDSLVRVSNPPHHGPLREMTGRLMESLSSLEDGGPEELLDRLLVGHRGDRLDWNLFARQLMPQMLLQSVGMAEAARQRVIELLPTLVRLMLPQKRSDDWQQIDRALVSIQQRLLRLPLFEVTTDIEPERRVMAFIGLLIQSFDAGRGLLCHALRRALLSDAEQIGSGFVQEVLRFDSPIQLTRRTLAAELQLPVGDDEPGATAECVGTLPAGTKLVLILAIANRDAEQFANPDIFQPGRSNSDSHLTFGVGGHSCLARHYGVALTVRIINLLLARYPSMRLLEQPLAMEPLVNARLPRQLPIRLG
ncbi:cytochrome P450 [Marinobacterium arenosum]|uniref:cytochrome P450 n=1 Tax=Marinobacterium arenosum TaxID=2862496 RepID=UPI001C942AE7|nr:cytochrome P450 [Marinobacterium arenosum]MBY4675213.1 cytochrome P450 [Marinobacterium arenosum]